MAGIYYYSNLSSAEFIYLIHSQVKSGTIFDNFLITDSEDYAKEFGNETWGVTKDAEKKMKEEVEQYIVYVNAY